MPGDVGRGEGLGPDGEHRHEPAEQQQPRKRRAPEDLAGAVEGVPQEPRRPARRTGCRDLRPGTGRGERERERRGVDQDRPARPGEDDQRHRRSHCRRSARSEPASFISERAGTYASSGIVDRSNAARAPPATAERVPSAKSRKSSTPIGIPGTAIEAAIDSRAGVARVDEAPRPHPVDGARQDAAAEDVRDEAEREGERGEERRSRPRVDEDRQRDGGDARPGDRDRLGDQAAP